MAEGKRIVFSTVTPNDQGGIIPNDVIDFARYKLNPVILCQHAWEQAPIGLMTDIRFENGAWSGVPVFHDKTQVAKEYKDMYDGGWIKACSIGGEARWRQKESRNWEGKAIMVDDVDENGNRTCEYFNLYEVSIVTLPSNPDAVTQLKAKTTEQQLSESVGLIYKPSELQTVITKLSSNSHKMTTEQAKPADTLATTTPIPAALPAEVKDNIKKQGLGAAMGDLFSSIGKILSGHKLAAVDDILDETPTAKAPKVSSSEMPKEALKNPTVEQPTPIGLSAKDKAKKKADEAKKKAQDAVAKAEEMKAKAEADDATEEMKASYKAACDEMAACMNEAQELCDKYEAMSDDDEDEEMKASAQPAKAAAQPATPAQPTNKTTHAAAKPAAPQLKTMEELKAAAVKIQPAPQPAKVIALASKDIKISKLMADFTKGVDNDGTKLMGRVMSDNQEEKQISDYALLGAAMMNDPKYRAIVEHTRFHVNKERSNTPIVGDPKMRGGLSLQGIVGKLASGYADFSTNYGMQSRRSMTKLNATDDFLASPDLFAVEFLNLAIFALFPQTDWKNDIPIFGAQMSADNTGFIWANIAADPAIAIGTAGSPSNYTYNDTPVSMQPVPYFLQPMLWTPITYHQLRYDQMATGWAQAFAKMGSVIDDNLIYNLASIVPASSIVTTSGITPNPNGPVTPQYFTLTGTAANPNAFIWNPSYNGSLLNPSLIDIITTEQIYSKQYYELAKLGATLVIDSTTEAFFAKDPYTLSLLTRWVGQDGTELGKFKNTKLPVRSRVAVYDTATQLVKDPYGVIPATSVSANLGFIPSQVGIGLALLDVFMVQAPGSYGFIMSADTRVGINALRANFNGLSLYTYGAPAVGSV